jgi:hypothetical protein
MKLKIFFGGTLAMVFLLLLAGCNPNPIEKPQAETQNAVEVQTQNVEINTAENITTENNALTQESAGAGIGTVPVPPVPPVPVPVPGIKRGTSTTKINDSAATTKIAPSKTEQIVTFDPKDSTTAKLAKCLTQKGVLMYGAFWCPHCADQKSLFGDDFHYVNYIECDPKGPNSQTTKCTQDKIQAYPTWYFPKSGFVTGGKELVELANLSGCEAALQ